MPRVLNPGQIVEVLLVGTLGDQSSINVLHAQVLAGPTTATDLDTAVQADALFQGLMKALMTNQSNYRGAGCRILNQVPTAALQSTIANQGLGHVGGIEIPSQDCGLIFLRTDNAGRSQRGRIYLPFLGGDSVSLGGPTAAYLLAANAIAVVMTTPFLVAQGGRTASLRWVIYHRKAHTSDAITFAGTRGAFATQRKRGAFGRPNNPPF